MTPEDIRKCKKNRNVWRSDFPKPLRIGNGSTFWPKKGEWNLPYIHPTRAAAQAAIDERKRLAESNAAANQVETPKPTTVRGWLETIPDPAIRAAAIKQCEVWDKNCTCLKDAITNIWAWSLTSEGTDFWMLCCNAARDGTPWPAYPHKAKKEADVERPRHPVDAMKHCGAEFSPEDEKRLRKYCDTPTNGYATFKGCSYDAETGVLSETYQCAIPSSVSDKDNKRDITERPVSTLREKHEADGRTQAEIDKAAFKDDPVSHPAHYTKHPSGVECIQITEHMGFCLGNAIKYIWRADLKGDAIEDLKKAIWYINREIEKRTTGNNK